MSPEPERRYVYPCPSNRAHGSHLHVTTGYVYDGIAPGGVYVGVKAVSVTVRCPGVSE